MSKVRAPFLKGRAWRKFSNFKEIWLGPRAIVLQRFRFFSKVGPFLESSGLAKLLQVLNGLKSFKGFTYSRFLKFKKDCPWAQANSLQQPRFSICSKLLETMDLFWGMFGSARVVFSSVLGNTNSFCSRKCSVILR